MSFRTFAWKHGNAGCWSSSSRVMLRKSLTPPPASLEKLLILTTEFITSNPSLHNVHSSVQWWRVPNPIRTSTTQGICSTSVCFGVLILGFLMSWNTKVPVVFQFTPKSQFTAVFLLTPWYCSLFSNFFLVLSFDYQAHWRQRALLMVTQSYKWCQLWIGSASGGMSHKLKKKQE